jgi:hypothetical protein
MSKWSRLKVALLTATVTLSALQFSSGCNLDTLWKHITQYVVVGNLFD